MGLRPAWYGTIAFGFSAVLYGIISLTWPKSEMWQRLQLLKLPVVPLAGWVLAMALVVAGAGLLLPRTMRTSAAILAVVFVLFTLACVTDMAAAPANPGSYVGFFEQLSIVCGAAVLYLAMKGDSSQRAVSYRAIRVVFGICVISFALAQIVYLAYTASLVPAWMYPGQVFWTNATTVAFGLAAIAILVDRQTVLALRLLAMMLALFALLVWLPKIVAHPAVLSNWSELAMNDLIAAAAALTAEYRLSR